MNRFILTVVITLFYTVYFSQNNWEHYLVDSASVPREHSVNFEKMVVEVAFEPSQKLVKGKVTHTFTPIRSLVDSIYLDGPGIRIKEAKLNGKEVFFKVTAEGVIFYPSISLVWGSKDSLTIVYEANPRKGIYFIGWNDPANLLQKQIWTQGQASDNRYWIPCFDSPNDKLITEVIVHFDSNYKVLSNGTKISEKKETNNTTTWRYKMTHPHTSYLLMLGIGQYEVVSSKSQSNVPLNMWYYPNLKNRFDYTYKSTKQIFDFLEKEIGVPYPWESYSQIPVQDFMYGAMENTTATIFGDFFQVDAKSFNDKNYVAVNAHELAHQWFGDFVTARSLKHFWLQESFATHYNIQTEKEIFGLDHFDWERRQAALTAINTKNKKPLAFSKTPNSLVYQKGSQVLQMLRYVVGNEEYRKGIQRYLSDHKYANVDSEDLLTAFSDELGISLDWFWNEWVYKAGEPIYKVEFTSSEEDKHSFSVFSVQQVQEINDLIGLFKMPVVFEVHYTDGTKDRKLEWIDKEFQTVKVPNPSAKKIDFILFDPNSEIVKTIEFPKKTSYLKSQSLKAIHLLDRYDALVAMRDLPVSEKRETLKEMMLKNSFHAIQSEILLQLMADDTPETISYVKNALMKSSIKVKKGVASNTKKIQPYFEKEFRSFLTDSSYLLTIDALEKLCEQFPENAKDYLELTKNTEGTSGENVKVKWLKIAYLVNNDLDALKELISFSSLSFDFLTRINAMNALKQLNYQGTDLWLNCIDGSFNTNIKLANHSKDLLKYYYGFDQAKGQIIRLIDQFSVSLVDKENLKNWLAS